MSINKPIDFPYPPSKPKDVNPSYSPKPNPRVLELWAGFILVLPFSSKNPFRIKRYNLFFPALAFGPNPNPEWLYQKFGLLLSL